MMDNDFTGLSELSAKLDALKYETRRKGGRTALRKAAQLVRDRARQNASHIDDPATSAMIAKNIVERFSPRRYKNTGDLMFRVGVMGGAKPHGDDVSLPGGNTTHWRMIEFGTQNVRAQPFMRTAISDNIQAATDVFITEYKKAIDRAIKRAAKLGGSA